VAAGRGSLSQLITTAISKTLHHKASIPNISVYNKVFMKKVLVINRNIVLL
jgi:hypothetical protein